jgi:hypothetical protein
LIDKINEVPILKSHLPYFESDHLLNLAYNLLCGGTALDKRKVQNAKRKVKSLCTLRFELCVCKAGFKKIRFRGDTDFSQTEHLDRWDDQDVLFVFGMDARKNLEKLAESLENTAWERLERPPKYEVKTVPRGKRFNVKEQIVIEREYKNLTLEYEDIAEVEYKPTKCEKSYRLVVLRKTISVKQGQELLFPEIRYFFYITNDRKQSAAGIVFESNKRCNQENLIGKQRKGVASRFDATASA